MSENNKNNLLYFAGGIIGAVVGVLAVYILDKNEQLDNKGSGLPKKKLSKLGMGTVSMLWSLIEKGK